MAIRIHLTALSPLLAGGITLLVLAALVLSTAIFNLFLNPLRKYPGPQLWAASRIPLTISTLRGRYVHDINALHRRYGHVVRIAPNQLSFTDERAWRDICGVTRAAPLGMRKDERLNDLVGGAATNPDADPAKSKGDQQHTRVRKALAPAFTTSALRQQVSLITGHVDEMVKMLSDAAATGDSVDMCRVYSFTLYDIFSHLFLGESMNLVAGTGPRPWVDSMSGFARATTALAALSHFPGVRLLLGVVLKAMGTKSRDAFMNPCFDRFDRRIAVQGEKHHVDIVHFVLGNNKGNLSVKELRDFSPFLMIGGGETMASLLPCLTYLLLKHPKALGRLTEEIRSAFGTDDIAVDEMLRLPYLGACISEALRMYPPVPHGNDRIVPPGGAAICGDHVPGGTIVIVSHLSTYHQKLNWFRPDRFIPERWLPDTAPEFKDDCRGSFKPFSAGPQNCFGQELANLSMRLIMTKLLLNFDLKLENDTDLMWQADLPVYNVWMKPALKAKLVKVAR